MNSIRSNAANNVTNNRSTWRRFGRCINESDWGDLVHEKGKRESSID